MKNLLHRKLKIAIVCMLACVLALGGLTSCGTSTTDSWAGYGMDSYYLDTICRITIYGLDDSLIGEGLTEDEFGETCAGIIQEAFKRLASYENMLSRTKEGSDVYRINNSSGEEVYVDSETIEVLKAALTCGDMSGGAFDITIGGVSELWNFHALDEETAREGLPDEEALGEALKHVGVENLVVNFADNWVQLRDPETVIDLGGIAKGYIADRITEFLKEQGVTDAIVNLGGNIEALGGKPRNHLKPRGDSSESGTVRIGVNDPRSDSDKLLMTFDTRDVTVVTSGTYERYIEVDGVKYHHILDPKTGYPVDNGLIQVTIVGARGHSVYCDGLSTICLALGLEDGKALVDDLSAKKTFGPVWAIFVTTDGEVVEAGDGSAFTG